MFVSDIKLPILNGNGLEDLEKHWFLCEVVWTVKQVQEEAIKRAHMIVTFRVRALDRYMKFYVVPVGVLQKSLDQIQIGFIEEFKKPKSELQCITELKEIKQLSTEFVWDFDQIFNTLMAKVHF